jgi:hypothetical protein
MRIKTKHPLPAATDRGQGHEGLQGLVRPSLDQNIPRRRREVKDSPPAMDPELYKHLNQYKNNLIYYREQHRIVSYMVDCIEFLLSESDRLRKGVLI